MNGETVRGIWARRGCDPRVKISMRDWVVENEYILLLYIVSYFRNADVLMQLSDANAEDVQVRHIKL